MNLEQGHVARSGVVAIGALLWAISAFSIDAAAAAQEPAIAKSADDSDLLWGPCPDFLPKGCAISVLHGDPSKPNVDVFFRIPGGADLPLHWHTSAERMVLVAGELHVAYEGQQMSVLKPGTYAYGPARRAHSGRCVSAAPCILFIAFESPLDAMAGHAE